MSKNDKPRCGRRDCFEPAVQRVLVGKPKARLVTFRCARHHATELELRHLEAEGFAL